MANLQKLIDFDGLSYFLGQIKAKFVRSVNGVKPDSKGNVNIANMEGATSNVAGKAGLVPIPTAGKQDMALCGDATFKVLPIAGGGTGANTISAACKALGLDWDWFHRYGLNYVPPDVTNRGWNSLGLCLIYYTEAKIKNQPSTYGQLLNIPATQDNIESTQIWIEQCSGALYFRGGNSSSIVNDEVFTRVATEADVSSAGYGIIAANFAQNGYVKFANGLILQWGTKYVSQNQSNVTVNYVLPVRDTFLITLTTTNTSDIGYNGSQVAFNYTRTGFTLSHTGKAQTKLYFAVCIAQQWGKYTASKATYPISVATTLLLIECGNSATVTITMPIASTPINIQVTATGLSSNIPSAYRTKNIARGRFDIQVYAWEADYFWLALCKNQQRGYVALNNSGNTDVVMLPLSTDKVFSICLSYTDSMDIYNGAIVTFNVLNNKFPSAFKRPL